MINMANEETFVLLSLEEQQSKELAQVISNETARKILDYLGKKNEASESQIAEALDTPISTVHYNVQQLLKSKLIESKEFEWSEKGKKILYYRLAKKLIVIAPKTSESLYNQLKNLIPVSLFTAFVGGLVYYFSKISEKVNITKNSFSELIPVSTNNAASSGAEATKEALTQIGADVEKQAGTEFVNKTTEIITQTRNVTNDALWFFIGAGFVIILLIIITLIKRKKVKK